MSYKQFIKDQAQGFYVNDGKSVEDISIMMKIPAKTLYRWKNEFEWDKALRSSGNVGMYNELYNQFALELKKAVEDKKLTDPATADALLKTSKLMEKLLPKKLMLSNIFNMLEDITNYAKNHIEDDSFLKFWAKHLVEISDHLRRKYSE